MEQYVAQQILKVRDALVERNLDEAYHQLYTLADPEYKLRVNPWEDVERAASQPSPAKAEQEGLKPISSYLREYSQLKEYEKLLGGGMRPEYTLEQVKAMGWQEVLHMLTGYVDILNLMDGTIYVLEEGAGEWEIEAGSWKWKFEMVFAALKELTDLKAIKAQQGETPDYLERKPKAWEVAKQLTTGYKIEKREQEGPWKVKVHHSISDTEAGREYDEYVTITDGRVEFYFDGGIDDNDEQLLCNVLNERKIKLDYNHEAEMVADFLEKELKRVNALQREQEGLRWVKAELELPKTTWRGPVITQRPDGTRAIKLSTRTNHGWVIEDRFNNECVIKWLSESTTPPVKEEFTGSVFSQPAPGITLGCISPEARDLLDTIMAAWELHYAGLQKNAPHVEITFYGFAYWLVRWSGLIQPATSALVKEAGQPTEIISREEDLIYRIVEQWGNAMCSMDEKVQWLKDYAAESRQQPAGESAVWVKATERLPDKSGSFYCRDLKNNRRSVRFYTAGPTGRNSVFKTRPWDVEWLDESGLASSTKEGEIAFAEWTAKGLWSTHGGMWYEYQNEDNPITGEQLYDLYLQSNSNT